MRAYGDIYKAHTLCELCANATGGCSWSRYKVQEPVEGWTAERRDILGGFDAETGKSTRIESYRVLKCPEFQLQDQYREYYDDFLRRNHLTEGEDSA